MKHLGEHPFCGKVNASRLRIANRWGINIDSVPVLLTRNSHNFDAHIGYPCTKLTNEQVVSVYYDLTQLENKTQQGEINLCSHCFTSPHLKQYNNLFPGWEAICWYESYESNSVYHNIYAPYMQAASGINTQGQQDLGTIKTPNFNLKGTGHWYLLRSRWSLSDKFEQHPVVEAEEKVLSLTCDYFSLNNTSLIALCAVNKEVEQQLEMLAAEVDLKKIKNSRNLTQQQILNMAQLSTDITILNQLSTIADLIA